MKFKFEIVQDNVVEDELKGFCFYVGWFRYLYDFKKFTIFLKYEMLRRSVPYIEVMRGTGISPKNKIKMMC